MTIQVMPKRSATMPKHGEKKVLVSGICTCPAVAEGRELARRFGLVLDVERQRKALEARLPLAATVGRHHRSVSPMRIAVCITLSSVPGVIVARIAGSGLSLKRIIMTISAPMALR